MASETLVEKQTRLKESAVLWAESLYAYKLICRAIGITEDTLKKYRNEDTDFSDRLEQSRTRFLNKQIKKARPEFLLERLESEHFKQRTESKTEIILPKPIMDMTDVLTDNSNSED